MTQDDHLVEIPVENWPELRDMFNVEWPRHIVDYYTIDNYILNGKRNLKSGTLGALQVEQDCRRRGLGTLIAKAMIRKLTDLRMDTFAFVNVGNVPSRRMFENLGFIQIDYVYWLQTLPTDSNIPSWTD
ncbi:glycine-N-acyltransferase-like protein 3 isoform X1 [Sergentomyia squamirostris]